MNQPTVAAHTTTRRPRHGRGLRRLATTALVAALPLVIGACGGMKQVDLEMVNAGERTVWVIAALVDDQDALAGYSTADLFKQKDEVKGMPGVLKAHVLGVPPGESATLREIPMKQLVQEKAWLVAVANFPADSPCARRRIEVATGSHLTVNIGLRNDCLELSVKQ